jgi:hypothetical protein
MSITLTISADVIPDIREGLYGLLGIAADRIGSYLVHPDRDAMVDGFVDARAQLERVFPLFDLVGWTTRDHPPCGASNRACPETDSDGERALPPRVIAPLPAFVARTLAPREKRPTAVDGPPIS